MDKDYKILSVQAREAYTTEYGTMQPYALTLEGVEGYVQLSQKPETPAPQTGDTIHGHTYPQGKFLKFKKVNPNYPQDSVSKAGQGVESGRALELLEAIAVAVGADVAVKQDTILDDVDDSRPIDLSEIPF